MGTKVSLFHGKISIHDKRTSFDHCTKIGLPYGFDGPMQGIWDAVLALTALYIVIQYIMEEEHKI